MNIDSISPYNRISELHTLNFVSAEADIETGSVKVTFSDEAYQLLKSFSMSEKTYNALFNNEISKAEKRELLDELVETDNTQKPELEVTSSSGLTFLDQYLSDILRGKVENASVIASQITENIRATINQPELTVEERAFNREMALKQAQYIAQHYFEDREQAREFLSVINRYANNDILREKGYVMLDGFIKGEDVGPIEPYSSLGAPDDYVRLSSEFYEQHGYDPVAIAQEKQRVIAEFEAHEKYVQMVIEAVKASMSQVENLEMLSTI